MGGWHMDGDWGWWMIIGSTWMVIFWGLLIWGAVVLFQRSNREVSGGQGDDPVAILERRYARGEITKEEFEEARTTLRRR